MAGTYWLTILPDTSKLKPAINAAMRGEKIKADFGVDEAKARKAGADAAKAAEQGASKSKPKVKPEADKPAARKAGEDAASESAKPVEQKRPKVKPQPDIPGSRKAGEDAGNSAASGITSTLGKIGPMLAGLGIAGALKSSLMEGMDFTTSLNTMGAVSRATADQLAQVSEKAKQLGSDAKLPGVSATTAAQAMTELAKGGFSVQESMEAVRGTLQLAGAAQIDAATAATIQADTLHTFGLSAKDAGYAADVLANVSNASTGEITDFAQGFQQAGAVASQFGLKIDDTAAALGTLANQGIKGSDAGTLIKSALLAITDQGNPAQGAIKELGLTLYDAQGQFVGMSSMMGQLGDAAKRMSPEMYQAATNTLFGSDAARLAGVAAKQGSEGFDLLKEAVNRQGTAAETSEAKTRGLPGAWLNFQNSVDNVKLSVSEFLDGPLSGLLNKLSGLPAFVERNADAFKIAAGVITTLLVPALIAWTVAQAKAIGTSIVGTVMSLIGSWTAMAAAISSAAAAAATYAIAIARGVAASIVAGLSSMIAAFKSLAIGTRLAAAAQAVFNVVMMANPIGLIVAAIAAVVAGLIYFFTQTELGQKIWAGFTEYLKTAWDTIKSAFAAAWDFIGNIWDSMVTKAGEVWDGIKTRFTAVVDFVKGLPGKVASAARGLWDGLKSGLVGVLNWIGDKWNSFAETLSIDLPGSAFDVNIPKMPRFASGGYTGNVPTDRVAGVVHGGEYVIKASSRERLENLYPHLLDYLNNTGKLPGYYGGGRVALGNISGAGITTAEQQSMWDAIRSAFPDAVLSSATRTVMTEGHPDFHNAGRAIDLTGPNMGAMAAWIAENYPDSLELIYSPFSRNINDGRNVGNGMDFYGAGTMAAHEDHVHWALGRNAEGSKVGAAAGSSSSGGGSTYSTSGGGGGGGYRAATSSELSASSSRLDNANDSVRDAQQRIDDKTFTRDQAQKRLDKARAEGKDISDEEQALAVATRELADANDNLAEKRTKLAEVEAADTELREKGKYVESSSSAADTVGDSTSAASSKNPGGDLGQMFVGGILESIGLDGSLFSNPLEWPTVKSAFAGVNWLGKLLSGEGTDLEGGTATAASAGVGGGFAAGAAQSVGLGGLLSAIPSATATMGQSGSPALAPGEFNPAVPGATTPTTGGGGMSAFAPAPHTGSGQAPGPVDNSININGPVGLDPGALQTKIRTEQNARTRTTVVR